MTRQDDSRVRAPRRGGPRSPSGAHNADFFPFDEQSYLRPRRSTSLGRAFVLTLGVVALYLGCVSIARAQSDEKTEPTRLILKPPTLQAAPEGGGVLLVNEPVKKQKDNSWMYMVGGGLILIVVYMATREQRMQRSTDEDSDESRPS